MYLHRIYDYPSEGESMNLTAGLWINIGLILFTNFSYAGPATDLPADDQDYGCISQQKAQQYTQDFEINISSFGGNELCDSSKDTKKLFNDLQIIEGGQFTSSGQNLLIKNFIPADKYYTWMKSMTRGIERGNDIPFATAYNSGGYFTMQDGWALLSTLGRVGTVIHEARHTGGYYHIQCTFGPYANSTVQGCDRDYSYGGSHAIEMEYYARVSTQGSNFHPVYKSMARLMAMGRTNFVFNKSPIQKKSALVAINEMSEGLVYFQKNMKTFEIQHPELRLKRTSFGATLLDGLQALAIDIYQNAGFQRNVIDDYSYYKLLKQDRGQGLQPMKDVEEVDLGNRRYFFFMNQQNQVASYVFPKGALSQFAQAPNQADRFITALPDGSEGIYVITNQNEIYSMNPDTLKMTKLSMQYPADLKSVTKFEGQTLLLNQRGEVLVQNGKDLIRYNPFQNSSIKQLVSAPVYDAFEVR